MTSMFQVKMARLAALNNQPQTPAVMAQKKELNSSIFGFKNTAASQPYGAPMNKFKQPEAPFPVITRFLIGSLNKLSKAPQTPGVEARTEVCKNRLNNVLERNGGITSLMPDSATPEEHGKSAGRVVAGLIKSNAGDIVATNDIKYMYEKEDGMLSVKSGMAYSHASMDPYRGEDGKVAADQFGKLGEIIDTDDDGVVSDLENLAYTYYQDNIQEPGDGIVTPEENQATMDFIDLASSVGMEDIVEDSLKNIKDMMEPLT